MNLSPAWATVLEERGWQAVHWSSIGEPSATDSTLLAWARDNEHIVITHDLDFGAILAATGTSAPSVIQVRTHNVTPLHLKRLLIDVIDCYEAELRAGALIIVDENRARARILPLKALTDDQTR